MERARTETDPANRRIALLRGRGVLEVEVEVERPLGPGLNTLAWW